MTALGLYIVHFQTVCTRCLSPYQLFLWLQ